VTVIHWNGQDIPKELKALPEGTYEVRSVEESLALDPEEEQGLLRALDSIHAGKGLSHETVRERVLGHVRGG
jgi:hypothetical protein